MGSVQQGKLYSDWAAHWHILYHRRVVNKAISVTVQAKSRRGSQSDLQLVNKSANHPVSKLHPRERRRSPIVLTPDFHVEEVKILYTHIIFTSFQKACTFSNTWTFKNRIRCASWAFQALKLFKKKYNYCWRGSITLTSTSMLGLGLSEIQVYPDDPLTNTTPPVKHKSCTHCGAVEPAVRVHCFRFYSLPSFYLSSLTQLSSLVYLSWLQERNYRQTVTKVKPLQRWDLCSVTKWSQPHNSSCHASVCAIIASIWFEQ